MKLRKIFNLIMTVGLFLAYTTTVFAQEAHGSSVTEGRGLITLGASFAMAIVGLGVGLGQGRAVSAAMESIGRNPAAAGKLQLPLILGLVFMEVVAILSFVIALEGLKGA